MPRPRGGGAPGGVLVAQGRVHGVPVPVAGLRRVHRHQVPRAPGGRGGVQSPPAGGVLPQVRRQDR